MYQNEYIDDLPVEFGFSECEPSPTPMVEGFRLSEYDDEEEVAITITKWW